MIILILLLCIIIFILLSNSYTSKYTSHVGAGESKYIPMYSRILDEASPRETYTNRDISEKIVLKCGQLKLLLTEIEFYTHLDKNNCRNVIYIGSAPGNHSVHIAQMFPKFNFVYYDPRPFVPQLYEYKNIRIINEFFNDDTIIPSHITRPYAFVSDIRTGTEETYVAIDMEMQYKWVKQLSPDYAMLKFRLPWSAGTTNYFAGEIRPQPFIGATSTETRLWVTKNGDYNYVDYDNDKYNNMLYYFNKYSRLAYHEHNVNINSDNNENNKDENKSENENKNVSNKDKNDENVSNNDISNKDDGSNDIEGIDHCYDCWTFIKIINEYIKHFAVNKTFADYYKSLGYNVNVPPHGSMPDERDTSKKISILENITKEYNAERVKQHESMLTTFVKKDMEANEYLCNIENMRKKYATDEYELYTRGLVQWYDEIDTIVAAVKEHKTIVIISDYVNDYIHQLKNMDAKFIIFYNHKRLTFNCPNVTIIYDIPRKDNKLIGSHKVYNFTKNKYDFLL